MLQTMPDLPTAPGHASLAESPGAEPGFAGLGLAPTLLQAAEAAGWTQPTPVQAAVLPPALQGRDVLALAPTGSGKTAAFLLPLLQTLLAVPLDERPRRLRALVLAPTRELALQTLATARRLAPQLKQLVAVGGVSINPQLMALRGGTHVLVATPGRLLDLQARHALDLSQVTMLVLDEADRLLDLGFAEQVDAVLALLPTRRQNLLLSATLPEGVQVLAQRVLRDALTIDLRTDPGAAAAASAGAVPAIVQRAIVVDAARRTVLLRHLMATQGWRKLLVFVATQHASEQVADKLRSAGLPAAALHGQLSQGRRSQVLADLHEGHLAVLVATDLAARGLDIAGLDAVVNHDLPRSAVDHTHRIGRTARAGAPGVALSFICADVPGSEAHFRLIEKRQQQRVLREQVAGYEPAATQQTQPAMPGVAGDLLGGVKGRRKSKKDKLREAAAAASVPARRVKA